MILLTSPTRVGKSTAIHKIINMLGPQNCFGFYSEETRENGERTGFRTTMLGGGSITLANVSMKSKTCIGRYGVDVGSFEKECLPVLEKALEERDGRYLIIDEIGPMQLLSERYKDILYRLLNSDLKIIGSIVYQNDEWLEKFKADERVRLLELSLENRNRIPLEVCDLATKEDTAYQSKVRKARNYVQAPERFEKVGNKIVMRSTHDVRTMTKENDLYRCTCDYYAEKGTCSHIMSVITMNLL